MRLHPIIASFCLCLSCLMAIHARAAVPERVLLRVAANEACSQEAKSSNNLQLAQSRMQAARADLEVSRGGRCRPNALKLMQYAYRALEALEKQETAGPANKPLRAEHLKAIRETMNSLRGAEQAVEQSMKNDPQGKVGVNVTPLDNAMHALDTGYRMSASAETPPG